MKKTDLPHKELEQFMLDNMDREKVYTLPEFYALYKSIMNRDGLIENYSVMNQESFRKLAGKWSKPGGPIIRYSRLKHPVYHKRVVHKSNISATDLKKKANEIINCVAGRIPSWLKWL